MLRLGASSLLRNRVLRRSNNFVFGRTLSSTPYVSFIAGKAQAQTAHGLLFGTGIMGHLSESSVVCGQGGTVVHAVVNSVTTSEPKEAFLPLTVDYRSRHYAFGQIPIMHASRRERHGGEDEILAARCIDRVVRPLFPKGYVDEVQILATSHAADGIHDPTIAAVNATSFALMQSKQPWFGPVGCVRVALIDGELQVDPSLQDLRRATMDLVYAGTKDRALMVEAIADQVPEETVQRAMGLANAAVSDIIGTQLRLLKQIEEARGQSGGDAGAVEAGKNRFFTVPPGLAQAAHDLGYRRAVEVYSAGVAGKAERGRSEGKVRGELLQAVMNLADWAAEPAMVKTMAVDEVMHRAFRAVLLGTATGAGGEGEGSEAAVVRADGRAADQVRPLASAVEVLPTVHGSAYFARGDTHVLGTVTLGPYESSRSVLPIDGSGEEKVQPFMLHYDFPPYSTGELGNATAPNRRMVGHGNLAEKALRPVMPPFEEFPYAVRVYCECTGSNGSSSMASVCAGSLALYDAGVPLKAPVAAVSVGLVTDEALAVDFSSAPTSAAQALAAFQAHREEEAGVGKREFVVLRDLTGSEDHHGDMDYKIGGTEKGITAIQLDVKLPGGVPLRILDRTLDSAREGRLHILQHMQGTLAQPRTGVKPHAPKAELVRYDADRKGLLVGPRGEMIKYMEELYGVTVDLESVDTMAYIYGKNAASVAACSKLVQDIAVVVKEGDTVTGTVTAVMDYGLVVTVNRAQQALLHSSELTHDKDLAKKHPNELVRLGQRFNLKVLSVDNATGMIKVSRRALLDASSSVPDVIRPLASSSTGPMTITTIDPMGNRTSTTVAPEPDVVPTFPQTIGGLGLAITEPFPMNPPRSYSPEYFSSNVATDVEVAAAVKREHQRLTPAEKKEFESATDRMKRGRPHRHQREQRGGDREHSVDRQKGHKQQQQQQPRSQRAAAGGPQQRPSVQDQAPGTEAAAPQQPAGSESSTPATPPASSAGSAPTSDQPSAPTASGTRQFW